MHPVEFSWFKFLVLLTGAIAIGFGILNIVYFNRIRLNDCEEISETEATVALWLNIILVIFGAIIFFWSLFRLIFSGEEKKDLVNTTINTHYYSKAPVSSN